MPQAGGGNLAFQRFACSQDLRLVVSRGVTCVLLPVAYWLSPAVQTGEVAGLNPILDTHVFVSSEESTLTGPASLADIYPPCAGLCSFCRLGLSSRHPACDVHFGACVAPFLTRMKHAAVPLTSAPVGSTLTHPLSLAWLNIQKHCAPSAPRCCMVCPLAGSCTSNALRSMNGSSSRCWSRG